MSGESESFLYRWSRRKHAAERAEEQPAQAAAPEVTAIPPGGSEGAAEAPPISPSAPLQDPAATAEMPLPPIESLDGLRSDYLAFFQQPVAEDLRRAALMKLFADPHFNQMDMLDVYVDDYTQFEQLPTALRMRLPSARAFLLDSERAALDAVEASEAAAAGAEGDPVSSPGAGDEAATATDGGADVESTPALAAMSDGAPSDAASPDGPSGLPDDSLSVIPPGKATAPDPSST